MKDFFLAIVTVSSLCVFAFTKADAQTIITQWLFTGTSAAGTNSPIPTAGSGTAMSLGMTNTYAYAGTAATNSVTSDDIVSSTGTGASPITDYTWRIRGVYQSTGTAPNKGSVTNSGNVNGWNLLAPQYSQGVEFDVSTFGYIGITVSFDWFCTTQGIRDLQEQYNLDVNNPSGWTNINLLQVAVPNSFDGLLSPNNTIDLSDISGASDNPTFGIRLVSAYDPAYSGTAGQTYTSATLTSGTSVQYNNNSGNWRFDDITVQGNAIPEPTTHAIIISGFGVLAGFQFFRYRRK